MLRSINKKQIQSDDDVESSKRSWFVDKNEMI